MQSFENRMLQLETKPNNRILENSVQPQQDKGKSPKAFPTAWITAPSQLNPDRHKILNFSTNISDQKFGVTLDSAPLFLFGAPQPIKSHFPWLNLMLLARSTLTEIKSLDFQHPKTFRALLGRPLLLRMALSLVPRQIWTPHKNHRLSHTLTTTLLISNICDEFLIRLWTKVW